MVEVQPGLFVGTEADCRHGSLSLAVVHACKNPCHVNSVGYRDSLPASHPNYLYSESGNDLALNMIDPPVPLFRAEMFAVFLAFSRRQYCESRPMLIHCNQGESRAPSLALVFMAKIARTIGDASYDVARADFERVFSGYRPGDGICTYLCGHWVTLGES